MACDNSNPAKFHIAIGGWDRVIQVWKLDSEGSLYLVFSVQFNSTVPKTIGFAESGDIYIFGLFNGFMCIIKFPKEG